jgi:cyclopropane fatty-acyl-phospholipid synthase-like methyltransferase
VSSLTASIVAQFERPHGLFGRLAGRIMAGRRSNIERSHWTVELLQLEPGHRVLEIGSGPGLALQAIAARLDGGRVTGLDQSPLMIAQARRRLQAEIAAGKVELTLASLTDLDVQGERFDRILSINVVQFLPDLDATFARLRRHLMPDGRCATTFQPRLGKANGDTAVAMAERIERAMHNTDFAQLDRHELPLRPAPAVCVIGR